MFTIEELNMLEGALDDAKSSCRLLMDCYHRDSKEYKGTEKSLTDYGVLQMKITQMLRDSEQK